MNGFKIKFKIISIFFTFLLFFIFIPFSSSSDVNILSSNDDDLVFIHHSCGRNWLQNSLNDALISKNYIDERNDIYYNTVITPNGDRPGSLGDEPGDNTNMNHWICWFNDYFDGILSHGCEDGFNKIIMFKSCYPASNIGSDGSEPGDPFSPSKTIANYKAVYRHPTGSGNTYTYNGYSYKPLEDVFSGNPDILFIPVIAPPRHYAPNDGTNNAQAHRARIFNNWLKNDWLNNYNTANPDLNNVAVFDWFDVLAYADSHSYHPNRLKAEYGGETGNSHPNNAANSYSTQVFASNTNNFLDTAWDAFNDGPVNHPPIANNDQYEIEQNTTLNIVNPGVLENDEDQDMDSLTAVLVDEVSHGILLLNNDGSFTYTPDANYYGTDSFTYKANDDTADSNIATVTININSTYNFYISKPTNAFYLFNYKITQSSSPFIIGNIDVEVYIPDEFEVEKLEFYIDDDYKSNDTEAPFTYEWNQKTPFQFKHKLKIKVYDIEGFAGEDEIIVWKIL